MKHTNRNFSPTNRCLFFLGATSDCLRTQNGLIAEPKIIFMPNGEMRYSCVKCGVKYKKMSGLRSHAKECGRGAKCPFCPKVVTQKRNLNKHVQTHLKSELSTFKENIAQFIHWCDCLIDWFIDLDVPHARACLILILFWLPLIDDIFINQFITISFSMITIVYFIWTDAVKVWFEYLMIQVMR